MAQNDSKKIINRSTEDVVSSKTADVVCQDMHLPEIAQNIDEDVIQDSVQLVQLSETILKMFADSNKEFAQVQQVCGQIAENSYDKQIQEMQYKFSMQYNLVIADYKKLDRDYNEALHDKLDLEEEINNLSHSYKLL